MANEVGSKINGGLQVMFDENPLGAKEEKSNMSRVISKKRIILVHPGHG